MTDHDFELRLRADLRELVNEPAPATLQASVIAIPDEVPTSRGRRLIPEWRVPAVLRAAPLALAAAAVIAIVLVGIGVLVRPPNIGPAPGSLSPSAIETATPMASAPPPAFDGYSWSLDFGLSGLSDRVTGCRQCRLGSSITFNNGGVAVWTGAGGGCDGFNGTYAATGRMLHISVTPPIPHGCYPGRVRQINARLLRVAMWNLSGCASGICNDLTLMDIYGNTLLVYSTPVEP